MSDTKNETKSTLKNVPVIPLRGLVLYPDLSISFDVGRKATVEALKSGMEKGRDVFVVAQRDVRVENPKAADLFRVGTIGQVRQVLEIAEGIYKVLVEGRTCAKVSRYMRRPAGYYTAQLEPHERTLMPTDEDSRLRLEAGRRRLTDLFAHFAMETGQIPPDAVSYIQTLDDPTRLMDQIAAQIELAVVAKQNLLEQQDPLNRMEYLLQLIEREWRIFKFGKQIDSKVQHSMNRAQQEYYIREQIKTLEEELGDESELSEIGRLYKQLEESGMPEESKEKVRREIERFKRMPSNFPEASVQLSWLEMLMDLPFGRVDEEKLDISRAREILERDHYGMKKVKERILEYLAVRQLQVAKGETRIKGPILCFVGPPGVGKTSIAKSIAEAMGRRYIRMSLGGVRDEAEIRGHRRTYVGAMPGRIMQGIRQVDTDNPLFLLDEIDKLGGDFRGDPSSALLEVLDPEQNNSFRDHYVELPYDLSKVMFITTANMRDAIPEPLLDRMEVIELSGYTQAEKMEIARRHLLPKQLEAHGLAKDDFKLTDDGLSNLISWYTAEAGVRQLERELARLCRKIAIAIAEEKDYPKEIKADDLEDILGRRKFTYDLAEKENQVGAATGLAWTYAGGDTLTIEVNLLPGKGRIEMTGHLGDVMKESAKAALTYCRSRYRELGVDADFMEKTDVHIHVPAGAVPKDGPSAGITMATALASALSKRPVRSDLAMTGEISLRGKVLPIGGLKEKSVAAHRAQIKEILIPKENERELEDIPESVKKNLVITPVETMDDVLAKALTEKPMDDKKSAKTSKTSKSSADSKRKTTTS